MAEPLSLTHLTNFMSIEIPPHSSEAGTFVGATVGALLGVPWLAKRIRALGKALEGGAPNA